MTAPSLSAVPAARPAPRSAVGRIPLMSRLSVRVGLFGISLVFLTNLISLGAVAWALERKLVADLETDLATDRAAVSERLVQESRLLAVGTRAIAGQATVRALLGTEGVDTATLVQAADGLRSSLAADSLILIGGGGQTLASSPPGIAIDGDAMARMKASDWTSVTIGGETHLAVLQAIDVGGKHIGSLVSTRALGEPFIASLLRDDGDELMIDTGAAVGASALHSVASEELRGITVPPDGVARRTSGRAALLVAEVPLGNSARILLVRNRTEAFERFGPILLGLLGLGLGTLTVSGLVSALVGQRLARPIQRLTDAAQRVAAGDLSEAVDRQLPDPRSAGGEARELAAAFRQMLDEVRRSRTALEAYAERLEHEVSLKAGALERSKAADRAKSSFLANMSHELRTPLNAIIGYSEMLTEELTDSPEAIADLDRIHGAGTHLLALINSILDLSKIEAGKMELHLESSDLPTLVREVAGVVRPLADKGGNKLVIKCPKEVGLMTMDVTKVRQILYNLLSNACKFTHGGEVELQVHTENRFDGREWVVLAVRDTGIGLNDEQMSRLFQEFSQADSSTTRKYGGTGLGLAISQRFSEMMGGDIQLTSALGEGTTFTVSLPRHVSAKDDEDDDEVTHIGRAPDLDTAMEAILIIDDDPAVRDILMRSLRKDGFRVVAAASGAEALRVVREQRFLAITLDVDMPGTDGWTVLQALKSDPLSADIPVVMVTIEDDRDRGFALGAEEFLSKPIDRARLRQVLERFRSADTSGWVLVVDDDEPNRNLIARTLEKYGWKVREAHNGRAALDCMATGGLPSAILLDLMMPEMDGFQFLRCLQDIPEGPTIPVVVLTAMELTAETRRQLASSVASVIEKGDYNVDALLGAVRARLARVRRVSA